VNQIEQEISEHICELNSFKTPEFIKKKFGREITGKELKLLFYVLTYYVPYRKWIKVWQKDLDNKE